MHKVFHLQIKVDKNILVLSRCCLSHAFSLLYIVHDLDHQSFNLDVEVHQLAKDVFNSVSKY